MILRHQLPVWSPLNVGALIAGAWPSADALHRVESRILQEYVPRKVVLTASGTVALAMAFMAATPPGKRPRVALPGWGCYDLMTAADAVDAEVLLYDLDPDRLSPDAGSLREVMNQAPEVLVVAHWFGVPIDLAPIQAEARERDILLIDDAAQGVGAFIGQRPAGSMGDFGVLSFGRGKGRTGGSGGALIANTDAAGRLLERATLGKPGQGLGSYAGLWVQVLLGRPSLYGIPRSLPFLGLGQTVYRPAPDFRGLPSRNAAVLDRTWDVSHEEALVRREHADRWLEEVPWSEELRRIEVDPLATPGWLRCPVRATGRAALTLSSSDARHRGIERGYPLPMEDLPVSSRRFARFRGKTVGARALAREIFSLPTHRWVTETDFGVVKALQF